MSGGGQPVVSRRGQRKNQAGGGGGGGGNEDPADELSKDEKQIARYLRLSCPKKQGNLLGMKVDFFVAQKLVDCLMESKWGPANGKNANPVLANRNACVALMQRFMNKQLFYRAVKIYKETSDDPAKEKGGDTESTPNPKKSKKKATNQTPSATPKVVETTTPSSSSDPQQQQQKRKFKLEMHEDQKFLDANEPYVWVYDPTSTKTYIIGSLLILGAIGICLFPLWPSQVREGVYYLSLTGASFLGAILGLAVLKYIVFGLVWAISFGSVHFWLLPNLTEDVGFFESFVPVYKFSMPSKPAAIEDSTVAAKKKDDDLAATTNSTATTSESKSSVMDDEQSSTSKRLEKSTLSGSTVEISSADVAMEKSTTVRRRKSGNVREPAEEDDFELVDGEDTSK